MLTDLCWLQNMVPVLYFFEFLIHEEEKSPKTETSAECSSLSQNTNQGFLYSLKQVFPRSLNNFVQLPYVNIEMFLRGNDKHKMSKSLVIWEELFPGMCHYIANC